VNKDGSVLIERVDEYYEESDDANEWQDSAIQDHQ
jgi:hypothetical protein